MWATALPSSSSSSVRQTRLGLKVDGIRAGNARVAAVVEADFFGGVPGVGIGENFGVVRLRLANVRLNWERTSLTIGQDWMVFAPQNPVSLAAAAIPQLAAAGNNWARLPQVKVEHRFNPNIALQAAVLAPQTGDSSPSPAFLIQPNSGAVSNVPFLQSRIVFSGKNWLGSGKPGMIGISGHFGRSRIFQGTPSIGRTIDSTGIAADWNFPLAKRVTLSGEVFFGQNLGGFQAGVFQGYNPDPLVLNGSNREPQGASAIGTRGGWVQAGFTPNVLKDRLTVYASFGIDDPSDEDLLSVVPRDWRTQNTAFAFDAIYRVTPQFSVGAEVRSFRTTYFLSGTRRATHFNLAAAYSF
ncbi:MAG: hypothetical protein IPM25_14355 [Chloracidobacterium sp.]|nr:hypothetical protein [Chloracidobacterium sp.]